MLETRRRKGQALGLGDHVHPRSTGGRDRRDMGMREEAPQRLGPRREQQHLLAHADLTVGSRVYLPTGRLPSGSTLGGDIEPGFVSNGAWIFDVAPEPLGTEPVTLRTWVGDGRLDSRLDIALDLRETVIPRTDLATASLIQVRTA